MDQQPEKAWGYSSQNTAAQEDQMQSQLQLPFNTVPHATSTEK